MITYEIKINSKTIKRIDARRHSRNDEMDKNGYEYIYKIYDYENENFKEGKIIHKYNEGFGKLLSVIVEDYEKRNNHKI